jgi:hypothetical protein
MYYLDLVIKKRSINTNKLFSVVRDGNRIRKWSLLQDTSENKNILQLITLSCCGQGFAEYFSYDLPSNYVDGITSSPTNSAFTVTFGMALHPVFDRSWRKGVITHDVMSSSVIRSDRSPSDSRQAEKNQF